MQGFGFTACRALWLDPDAPSARSWARGEHSTSSKPSFLPFIGASADFFWKTTRTRYAGFGGIAFCRHAGEAVTIDVCGNSALEPQRFQALWRTKVIPAVE
jgi:hypothetical protein